MLPAARIILFIFTCLTPLWKNTAGANSLVGVPGVHYPNYYSMPLTTFSCSEQLYNPGFYADPETRCQVFHYCYTHRQESFLCPVGTIFNQPILSCDYWYNSNCSLAPSYYKVNKRKRSKDEPETDHPSGIDHERVFDKIASLYHPPSDVQLSNQIVDSDDLNKLGDLPEPNTAQRTEKKIKEVLVENRVNPNEFKNFDPNDPNYMENVDKFVRSEIAADSALKESSESEEILLSEVARSDRTSSDVDFEELVRREGFDVKGSLSSEDAHAEHFGELVQSEDADVDHFGQSEEGAVQYFVRSDDGVLRPWNPDEMQGDTPDEIYTYEGYEDADSHENSENGEAYNPVPESLITNKESSDEVLSEHNPVFEKRKHPDSEYASSYYAIKGSRRRPVYVNIEPEVQEYTTEQPLSNLNSNNPKHFLQNIISETPAYESAVSINEKSSYEESRTEMDSLEESNNLGLKEGGDKDDTVLNIENVFHSSDYNESNDKDLSNEDVAIDTTYKALTSLPYVDASLRNVETGNTNLPGMDKAMKLESTKEFTAMEPEISIIEKVLVVPQNSVEVLEKEDIPKSRFKKQSLAEQNILAEQKIESIEKIHDPLPSLNNAQNFEIKTPDASFLENMETIKEEFQPSYVHETNQEIGEEHFHIDDSLLQQDFKADLVRTNLILKESSVGTDESTSEENIDASLLSDFSNAALSSELAPTGHELFDTGVRSLNSNENSSKILSENIETTLNANNAQSGSSDESGILEESSSSLVSVPDDIEDILQAESLEELQNFLNGYDSPTSSNSYNENEEEGVSQDVSEYIVPSDDPFKLESLPELSNKEEKLSNASVDSVKNSQAEHNRLMEVNQIDLNSLKQIQAEQINLNQIDPTDLNAKNNLAASSSPVEQLGVLPIVKPDSNPADVKKPKGGKIRYTSSRNKFMQNPDLKFLDSNIDSQNFPAQMLRLTQSGMMRSLYPDSSADFQPIQSPFKVSKMSRLLTLGKDMLRSKTKRFERFTSFISPF